MKKFDYQIKHAYFDNQTVMYKLFTNNSLTLKIKINRNDEIEVHASNYFSEEQINDFIKKYLLKYKKLTDNKIKNDIIAKDYSYITIFNKRYYLKLVNIKNKNKYEIIGSNIYYSSKDIKELIKKIYKDLTQPYIENRFKYWCKTMNLKATLSFQWMISKWGVYSVRQNHVTLSTQLGAFSKDGIDYLIVHELSHALQPNHSTNFWKIVESYLPNYKIIKKQFNLYSDND